MNDIKLLKNNGNRDWNDKEWIEEFYEFLQGNVPENTRIHEGGQPQLTKDQAFTVIWYLQEHLSVLPDRIEQCEDCKDLFDSWREGGHYQDRNYCGGCVDDHIPENPEDRDEE